MQRASLRPRLVLVWLAGVLAGTLGSYVAAAAASPGQSDPPESTTASTTAGTAPDGSGSPEPPDGSEGSEGSEAPEASEGPRHLALNTSPEDHERLVELGYDVFDVGPEASQIEALPEGGQAMLWVGDFSCDGGFGIPFDEFTGLVDELGDHPGVYGWYLVDEPDPEACPEVVEGIRQRADHIHEHAPGQVAFVAITDYEMGPLAPESSHVDLFGLDPYPCTLDDEESCDLSVMDRYMDQALDAGIPREDIAPVIQVFGQSCATDLSTWRLPTEAELQEILARWDTLVPAPQLEISYSWGRQEAWACPALVDADGTDGMPDLQSVMQQRNARTPPAGGGEGSGTGDGSRCPVPPTGEAPTDDPATADPDTGDTGTGDTGTSDAGTGDTGTGETGDTGTGDTGTGDTDPGGEPAEGDGGV